MGKEVVKGMAAIGTGTAASFVGYFGGAIIGRFANLAANTKKIK